MFPIGAAALPLQSASTSMLCLHAAPRMFPIGAAEEGMLLGLHFQKWLLHHVSEFKLYNLPDSQTCSLFKQLMHAEEHALLKGVLRSVAARSLKQLI